MTLLGYPLRLGALLTFVGLCVTVAGCTDRDLFPCGELTPGEKARLCDGPDEVCVCSVNRCAVRDPSCDESGLRYVFKGDGLDSRAEGCVEPDKAASAIDQQVRPEDQRACPAVNDARCGQSGDDGEVLRCPGLQRCSCDERRCVETHLPCPNKFRWAETNVCLTAEAVMKMRAAEPNAVTGLCDGAEFPERCGVSEGAPSCPTGTSCICEYNVCATRNPNCESGWQRADTSGQPAGTSECLAPKAPEESSTDGTVGQDSTGSEAGTTTTGSEGDGEDASPSSGGGGPPPLTQPDPESGICAGWGP